MKENFICPICHKPFHGFPALSRRDNKTKICSECGLAEAMEDFLLAEAVRRGIIDEDDL